MNSSDNILRRFAVLAAVVATFLLFGASGAQAAATHAVASSGSLVAEEHDTGDEEADEPSDEEDPSDEPQQDNEDSEDSDDEDSDDEDSDTEEPTDEPTDEPTFTEPPTTDPTDVTEMPTEDAGATSEAGSSPLGWILLAGGVASAVAAFLVYRRTRPL